MTSTLSSLLATLLDLTDEDTIAALDAVGVIVDANDDGVLDAGEFVDLTQLRGITEIIIPEGADGVDFDMTAEQALVAYTVDAAGVRSTWAHDADNATAEIAREDGDFRELTGNVDVFVGQDADISPLEGVDDLVVTFESLPVLTVASLQLNDQLEVEVDALGNLTGNATATQILEALTSPLSIVVDYVGLDFEGNPVDSVATVTAAFTKFANGTLDTVAVNGAAGAIAKASGEAADVDGILALADTIRWTGVGSRFSSQEEPLVAQAADDTFVFVAGTDGAEDTVINGFTTAAGNDILNFSGFLGAAPAALNGPWDTGPGVTLIENDVTILEDIAGNQDITTAAGLNVALAIGGEYAAIAMDPNETAVIMTTATGGGGVGTTFVFFAESSAAAVITTTLVGVLNNVDVDTFVLGNFA